MVLGVEVVLVDRTSRWRGVMAAEILKRPGGESSSEATLFVLGVTLFDENV